MAKKPKLTRLQQVDKDVERWEDRRETAIKTLCKAVAVLDMLYKRRARIHKANHRAITVEDERISVAAGEVQPPPTKPNDVPSDPIPDLSAKPKRPKKPKATIEQIAIDRVKKLAEDAEQNVEDRAQRMKALGFRPLKK